MIVTGRAAVVTVADAADRRLDAGLGKAFGVSNADVLGGFNRSSQHREVGGCDEGIHTSFGPVHTQEASIAGSSAGLAA